MKSYVAHWKITEVSAEAVAEEVAGVVVEEVAEVVAGEEVVDQDASL